MLKKYQYIFVVIFLGSMLFTVFQYVPILEEEIHASKTMTKKSSNPSPEKDGAADDDSGDNDEGDSNEFFNHSNYHNFRLFSSQSGFNVFHENYSSLISSITTPPPKI